MATTVERIAFPLADDVRKIISGVGIARAQ
jgi:hypothetical protein